MSDPIQPATALSLSTAGDGERGVLHIASATAACALDIGASTTGVSQILESKPDRGESPVPLARSDQYVSFDHEAA